MFYDNFMALCKQKGVTPSAVMRAIGLNKSSASYWKKGSTPSSDTLRKLADYFGVSMDYLSGNVWNPNYVLSESGALGVTAYTVLPDDVKVEKEIIFGKGPHKYVRAEDEIKKLSETARASLQIRLSSIMEDLPYEDLESLVKYAQFIQSQATPAPQPPPAPQEGKDTTPPPKGAEGPGE